MTAPDRIYAKVHGRKMRFHVGGETGGYPPALVGGWEEYPHTNAVEYIRADLATPAAMTPEVRALVDEVKFIRDTILKNTRDADGPHTITMPDGTVHTGPLVDLWHNINALIVKRLTHRLDALRAGGDA